MTAGEKYRQIRREAAGTGWALAVLIVFWCLAGFGLARTEVSFLRLPLWVWAAVGGSWLLALGLVKYLTARVFRDMELDEEEGHDDR